MMKSNARYMWIAFLISLLCTVFWVSIGHAKPKSAPTPKPKEKPVAERPFGWQCFNLPKEITILGQRKSSYRGQPGTQYIADTNDDGQTDMLIFVGMLGAKSAPFASFYVIDRDKDGEPDVAYQDMNGDGRCESMKLIPIEQVITEEAGRDVKGS